MNNTADVRCNEGAVSQDDIEFDHSNEKDSLSWAIANSAIKEIIPTLEMIPKIDFPKIDLSAFYNTAQITLPALYEIQKIDFPNLQSQEWQHALNVLELSRERFNGIDSLKAANAVIASAVNRDAFQKMSETMRIVSESLSDWQSVIPVLKNNVAPLYDGLLATVEKSAFARSYRFGKKGIILPLGCDVRQLQDEDFFLEQFDADTGIRETYSETIRQVMPPNKWLYVGEAMRCYDLGLYSAAVFTLAPLIEWAIYDRDNPKNVKVSKLLEAFQEREIDVHGDDEAPVNICMYGAISTDFNGFLSHSDFSEKEPGHVNRHWIAHGRTEMHYSALDVVKLISIIYGLCHYLESSDEGFSTQQDSET